MIRGTTKRNLDGVNMTVRRFGIPAFLLTILMFSGIFLVMILMFVNIYLMFLFIVSFFYGLKRLGTYIKDEAVKGNENPAEDYLNYLTQPRFLKQSVDFRKIYERERSK